MKCLSLSLSFSDSRLWHYSCMIPFLSSSEDRVACGAGGHWSFGETSRKECSLSCSLFPPRLSLGSFCHKLLSYFPSVVPHSSHERLPKSAFFHLPNITVLFLSQHESVMVQVQWCWGVLAWEKLSFVLRQSPSPWFIHWTSAESSTAEIVSMSPQKTGEAGRLVT